MTEWVRNHDVWYLTVPFGRYVIRRKERGSKTFRLWLNGRPTKHTDSSVVLLQMLVKIRLKEMANELET